MFLRIGLIYLSIYLSINYNPSSFFSIHDFMIWSWNHHPLLFFFLFSLKPFCSTNPKLPIIIYISISSPHTHTHTHKEKKKRKVNTNLSWYKKCLSLSFQKIKIKILTIQSKPTFFQDCPSHSQVFMFCFIFMFF